MTSQFLDGYREWHVVTHGLLDDLHREYDNTVLLVTHNELAAAFCDRILMLRDGQFVKELRTGRARTALRGEP